MRLPMKVDGGDITLLIVPEGIEIIFEGIEGVSPIPFNRTRRNWNQGYVNPVHWNSQLLIVPEGIEIFS